MNISMKTTHNKKRNGAPTSSQRAAHPQTHSARTTTSRRAARQARHARRRAVLKAFRDVTRLVAALPDGQYRRAKHELLGVLVAANTREERS